MSDMNIITLYAHSSRAISPTFYHIHIRHSQSSHTRHATPHAELHESHATHTHTHTHTHTTQNYTITHAHTDRACPDFIRTHALTSPRNCVSIRLCLNTFVSQYSTFAHTPYTTQPFFRNMHHAPTHTHTAQVAKNTHNTAHVLPSDIETPHTARGILIKKMNSTT